MIDERVKEFVIRTVRFSGENLKKKSATICMRNEKLYLSTVINDCVLSRVSCNDPMGVLNSADKVVIRTVC